METVHARKNTRHGNRPLVCAVCGLTLPAERTSPVPTCLAIPEWGLYRLSLKWSRQLLESGTDLNARREARDGLRHVVALEDARRREEAAYRAWRRALPGLPGRSLDLRIADEVVGNGWLDASTFEEIAARVPRVRLDRVVGIADRVLKALRGPQAPSSAVSMRRAA